MTPAQYFAEAIADRAEVLEMRVFINFMPDEPDLAICVYDTAYGRVEQREMRTGRVDTFPVVRVFVRGRDHSVAGVLQDLWENVLQTLYERVMSDDKILKQVTPVNTMVTMGHEPKTRRTGFSQQFRMCIE